MWDIWGRTCPPALCIVQSPGQGPGEQTGVHICKSHLPWCQGNAHSTWRNVVKKGISKTLPTFFGVSGRQSISNTATAGYGDSLKCQPKPGLSSHWFLQSGSPAAHEQVLGAVGMWHIVPLTTLCVCLQWQYFLPSLIYLLSLLLALFLFHQSVGYRNICSH